MKQCFLSIPLLVLFSLNAVHGMEITHHIDLNKYLQAPREIQTKIANFMIADIIENAQQNQPHMTLHPDSAYDNVNQSNDNKKIIDSTITSDGKKFIFADETHIKVLSLRSGERIQKIHFDKTFLRSLYYNQLQNASNKYDHHIKKIIVSPDSSNVAAISKGAVKVWNIESGQLLCSVGKLNILSSFTSEFSLYGFEFNNNGENFSTVDTYDGNDFSPKLKVWNVSTGKNIAIFNGYCPGHCIAFHPTQASTIALDNNSSQTGITIWDHASNTSRNLQHLLCVRLAYSKDGKKFLSSSLFTFKIWNETYQCLHLVHPHSSISSLAFNPDFSSVLSNGKNEVTLWNTTKGIKQFNVQGCGHYSQDGTKIIFPGITSKIVDAESFKHLYTIDHTAAAITQDNKIVSISPHGNVKIYQLPIIQKSIEWFGYNLSLPQAILICLLNRPLPHLFTLNESDKQNLALIPPQVLKLVVNEDTLKKKYKRHV